MNIAVILAGGVGRRLNNGYPKQFFKVAGKMVIEHTVDVFERNEGIEEIAIVINPAYITTIEEIVLKNAWGKVKKILKGGVERYDSSMAAINAYSDVEEANLIFHDAVRPLVNHRIIDDVISALDTWNAINVVIPTVDTIVSLKGDFVSSVPDRNTLGRVQTPQAFKLTTIREAYSRALQDPAFKATDDCGVVLKYLPEEKVFVVKGEESNIKLTHKEDIYLLEKLFQIRNGEDS